MIDPDAVPTDAPVPDRVAALHDHLRATGELPVETTASRWIAEAEAVVADVDGGDPPERVIRKRVGQAEGLLSNVEGTGDDRADRHVAAARELVASILDEVGREGRQGSA